MTLTRTLGLVTLYPGGWSWLRCLCAFPDTEVRRVRRVGTSLEVCGLPTDRGLDETSRGGEECRRDANAETGYPVFCHPGCRIMY
ncbi:hypothetical protein BDP81DRAFT_427308, partial [Colletotrichum phormii]